MRLTRALRVASLLVFILLVSNLLSSQKSELTQDDRVYPAWNGVKIASLVQTVPAMLPNDSQLRSSKHVCGLLVVVDAAGSLKRISLANKAPSPFDEAAINAVKQSRFEPGNLNGKPVSTRFMVWVPFRGNDQPATPLGGATPGKSPRDLKAMRPPVAIYTPEAKLSEEAVRTHYRGTVIVQVLIDEDGLPRLVDVLSAAGKGLDENAVAAVRQYRFKPATLEGMPIPFLMAIQITFGM